PSRSTRGSVRPAWSWPGERARGVAIPLDGLPSHAAGRGAGRRSAARGGRPGADHGLPGRRRPLRRLRAVAAAAGAVAMSLHGERIAPEVRPDGAIAL